MWSVALAPASVMYISWIKMKNSMRNNKQYASLSIPLPTLLSDSHPSGGCSCFHSFMVGHESHSHSDEETEGEDERDRE